MVTPRQLSHLLALLRSLKYMFAFASLVALAGLIFLASVHSRVTTAVLIGMIVCLGLLLTCAFFGWFALGHDPRLRFLYAGGVHVDRHSHVRRGSGGAGTMPDDIELAPLPPAYPRGGDMPARLEQALLAPSGGRLMYTMERIGHHQQRKGRRRGQ